MRKVTALQFEEYQLNEISTLLDTLNFCKEEIEDAENDSAEVKILDASNSFIELDEVREKLDDAIDFLQSLYDYIN